MGEFATISRRIATCDMRHDVRSVRRQCDPAIPRTIPWASYCQYMLSSNHHPFFCASATSFIWPPANIPMNIPAKNEKWYSWMGRGCCLKALE